MNENIQTYNKGQDSWQDICDKLASIVTKNLHGAEPKVWHGAPVWFIGGNPIVGYAVRKKGVQLLFWSGQSFEEPLLTPEGSFKASEKYYVSASEINEEDVKRWLVKARSIQWNYKDIVKNKGRLDLL